VTRHPARVSLGLIRLVLVDAPVWLTMVHMRAARFNGRRDTGAKVTKKK
jgi:hypothetical protein